MLATANAGTTMLTSQRDQLNTHLQGAMLRIDELAGKLQNSEMQAQHLAQRYQTDTAMLKHELLTGHSTLSASELSAQQSTHELGLRLVASEQAAQQVLQQYRQDALFYEQQATAEMQSMQNRAALQDKHEQEQMHDASKSRAAIGDFHAELAAMRSELATAKADAAHASSMIGASAEDKSLASTQLVRQLRAVVEQLTADNAASKNTVQDLNSKTLQLQTQAAASQAQLRDELNASQGAAVHTTATLQRALAKHQDMEMENATALAALNLRTQALSRERDAAVAHEQHVQSEFRNMEHALQDGVRSPPNWVDPTPAIQQQLEAEMESRFLGVIQQERAQHEDHVASLERKLAIAKSIADDVNEQLRLLQTANLGEEMEEDEQDEEATGNPAPLGGGIRTWIPYRKLLSKLRAGQVL